MAFELSEAGIAVARLGSKTELDFRPLKPGVLAISPLKDNVMLPDESVPRGARDGAAKRKSQAPRRGPDPAGLQLRAWRCWISTIFHRTPRNSLR